MNVEGEIKGCVVDGPLAIDIAFNKDAAVHKGIKGEVAGVAILFLCPILRRAIWFIKLSTSLVGPTLHLLLQGLLCQLY